MIHSRKTSSRKFMHPVRRKPEVPISPQEEQMVKKIRRAKEFIILHHHRYEIVDEQFQEA
jgi:hypothetical protein